MSATKFLRWVLVGALMIAVCPRKTEAASMEIDSISLSTISAQAGTNGLNITTSVYILAGSSLSLRTGSGFILGQSSITSSAFFGDGSSLLNVAGVGANLTWGGPATFLSSFTIQSAGRQISLSTGTATNNLVISPEGVISFCPELHNSSSTIIPNSATTAAACNICIAGSTLTITTSGGSVEVVFTGALENTSAGRVQMRILQDGIPLPSISNYLREIYSANMFSAASSLRYLIKTPSAGTHSYCISICTWAGGSLLNDAADANIFFVKELK